MKNLATIGLRSKTGRAIAIVLRGPVDSPELLRRDELLLANPNLADTAAPYHAVMHLSWPEAEVAAQEAVHAIQAVASKALARLMEEVSDQGMEVCGVAVVGSAERDLAKLGNYHIRAHAAEGILFRRVLEVAAKTGGLPCRTLQEKGLYERAAAELGHPAARVQHLVSELGQGVIRPWRADEKTATTAAWLALREYGQ